MRLFLSTALSIVLLSLIFVFGTSYSAKVSKPDFAFPQTVAANAEANLKKAVDAEQPEAAMEALIQIFVAKSMIDPDSMQTGIRTTEEVAAKFSASPFAPMYDALLAKMYSRMYNDNRYKYDRRSLPATPLPADLTEWSGEQYQQKIAELCAASCAHPQLLTALKTSSYPNLIVCDKVSLPYFPTLQDFVYVNALSLSDSPLESDGADLCKRALDEATSVGSKVTWTNALIKKEELGNDQYLAEYKKFSDSELSAPLLMEYVGNAASEFDNAFDRIYSYDSSQISEKVETARLCLKEIDAFISRFRSSPFVPNLKNQKSSINRQRLAANFPSLCYPGQEVDVKLKIANAQKGNLYVYHFTQDPKSYHVYLNDERATLIRTIPFSCKQSAPMLDTLSIKVKIDKPGYYAIVPSTGSATKKTYCDVMRCVPAVPMAICGEGAAYVAVSNAATWMPMSNVEVIVDPADEKKPFSAGTTNADGLVRIPENSIAENASYSVTLKIDGKQYPFENISLGRYSSYNTSKKESRISILTDRSIYHHGDTVRFLAIAQTASRESQDVPITRQVIAGQRLVFTFLDANSQEVDTLSAVTDAYGRCSGVFVAPEGGLSGNFSIRTSFKCDDNRPCYGEAFVTVSDYRMPDFRLETKPAMMGTPRPGWVTIKGAALSFADAPMPNTTVEAILHPSYYWRGPSSGTSMYSATVTSDDAGAFTIEIPDSVFKANPTFHCYNLSLNATSMTGSSAEASAFFTVGKKYMLDIAPIPGNVDGAKPFELNVKVTNTAGGDNNIPLKWAILKGDSAVASGSVDNRPIDLSKVKPDTYRLSVCAADPELADTVTTFICIYNANTNIVPDGEVLWIATNSIEVASDAKSVSVMLGTARDSLSIYCVSMINGRWRTIKRVTVHKGYHSIDIDCSGIVENSNSTVRLIACADCKNYSKAVSLVVKKEKPMQIIGETFRDKLTAGTQETWKLRLANADGSPAQGAMVLDMFNNALSYIKSHSLWLNPINLNYYSSFLTSFTNLSTRVNSFYSQTKTLREAHLQAPYFNFYDSYSSMRYNRIFNEAAIDEVYDYEYAAPMMAKAEKQSSRKMMIRGNGAVATSGAFIADDGIDVIEVEEAEAAEGGAETEGDFDYRESDVPLAIWEPSLTTDAKGNVYYTFTVPNANTTWQLQALAWTKDMNVASLMHTFVASKPLMVMPNTPRFLRVGDECTVVAQIVNKSEEAMTVTSVVEIFNPANGSVLAKHKYTSKIGAGLSASISTPVSAKYDLPAIGYRVRCSNGAFSDGEQLAIPLLPSEAQLVETYPFYLNPGDSVYTTSLPKAQNGRITLTFTENPAWTIVTALPGLRKDAGSTALAASAAFFSASIANGILANNPTLAAALKAWENNPADSALCSTLSRNEDLKIALLNATPWVQAAESDTERMARLSLLFSKKEVDMSVSAALATLALTQRPDGGWAWGSWCKESSQWVTSNVLAMVASLKQFGYLPSIPELDKMTDKALAYYDNCMRERLNKAKDKKMVTDKVYAYLRPQFSKSIPVDCQTVIANTTNSIIANWKSETDPAAKAFDAEALFINGYKEQSKQLMASVSQFGVWSKNQGLRFPSVNDLFDYASLLRAYALIEPWSKEVDGLRQQLIVRKQGDNWGSAVITSQVVASILASGTNWTTSATGASISAGSTAIKPQGPVQAATGQLRADLSKFGGKKLTISTSGRSPAYGAVYVQAKQKMTDVAAKGCNDLDIEKSLTVRRGTEWKAATSSLKVGDYVRVQLTIHCKRSLSYVTIVDERPAAFQPAAQLPGWLYSDGAVFYRVNGDSATNLYVVLLEPGTYILTYDMHVGQAGTYSSGVASIQSQYAPEISAHSSGTRISVK